MPSATEFQFNFCFDFIKIGEKNIFGEYNYLCLATA